MVRVLVLLNRGGGAVAADATISDGVRDALEQAGIEAETELIDGSECSVRCRAVAERGD